MTTVKGFLLNVGEGVIESYASPHYRITNGYDGWACKEEDIILMSKPKKDVT